MNSVSVLLVSLVFSQVNDGTVPRQPVVQPTPFVPPAASASQIPAQQFTPQQTVQQPTTPLTGQRQLVQNDGILFLPRRSHVPLAATERAVLMSLKTEQRDAAGNILQDTNGDPIMIPVTEGMNVFKGQTLGVFDDRELRSILKINLAQLEVAKAEKEKKIEVTHAARGYQVAIAEYKALDQANKELEKTFTQMEIQRAWLAMAQAEANLELQKYTIEEIKTREVEVQESELERTKVKIELRQLVTPIDGTVVAVKAAEGEWLREGDLVLEIMQLDTLRARIMVSVTEYEISDLEGKPATVRVMLANGRAESFQGTVVFCNPAIEAGTQKREVYVEIPNRRVGNFWLLQPGRERVEVTIAL
jgi:multidrug efflux pump subunit AcrA (membrane-fusion protein)